MIQGPTHSVITPIIDATWTSFQPSIPVAMYRD